MANNQVQQLLGVLLVFFGLVLGGCKDSIEEPTIPSDVICEPGFWGPTCEPCETGNFCTGDADPVPCGTGTWDDDQDPSTECLPWRDCRAGEYRMSEGTATEDVACPPCPARTYNRRTNASFCLAWTRCPPGMRAYDGTTTTDQKCEACPEGTFGQWVDSPECVEWSTCYAGSYVLIEPSEENDRICEFCALGTYNQHKNLPQCEPWDDCQPGQYMVVPGYHQASPVCEPCPEGMYTDGINQPDCRELGECQPGFFLASEPTQTAALACIECPIGTFCPGADLPLEFCEGETWDHDADTTTPCEPWIDCPRGHSAIDGSTTSNRTCTPCPPQHFAPLNSPACFPRNDCLAGTYLPDVDSHCTACAPGTYSTGINMPVCLDKKVCDVGTYAMVEGGAISDRSCWFCPPGTYSDVANASECTPWPECPMGSFVTGRSNSSAGTCVVCPPGTDTIFPNSHVCTPPDECPAGTRLEDGECVVCVSGTYCAGQSNSSWPCWGGVYWDHDANPATPCQAKTTCPPGTSVSVEGNALNDRQCVPCPAGQFSDANNAASCTPWQVCPDGAYVKSEGTSIQDRICATCPYGLVSNGPNAQACERPGYHGVYVGPSAVCAIRNHDSSPICWGEISTPNISYPINAIATAWGQVAVINSLGEVKCFGADCSKLQGAGYLDIAFGPGVCARHTTGMITCQNFHTQPPVPFDSFSTSHSRICGIRTWDRRFKCWENSYRLTSIPEQIANQAQADPHCILRTNNKIICENVSAPPGDFVEFAGHCGIRPTGDVVCWTNQTPQVTVPGVVTELSMDFRDVCVVRPDSTVTCHGTKKFANAAPNDRLYLAAHRTCALRASDNKVDCTSEFRGLGFIDWDNIPILNDTPLLDFRTGDNLRCGIRISDQKIVCQGFPTNTTLVNPSQWTSIDSYSAIEMDRNNVCGIRASDGQVSCWGSVGSPILSPPAGVGFDSISIGTLGCGIRTTDQGIECWGTQYSPPSGAFKSVTVGDNFACAIALNDSVTCFGNVPTEILGIIGSSAVEISAFERRICAIRATDHKAQCWGYPTLVQGLPGETLSTISAIRSGFCGIRDDGRYICRGLYVANPL